MQNRADEAALTEKRKDCRHLNQATLCSNFCFAISVLFALKQVTCNTFQDFLQKRSWIRIEGKDSKKAEEFVIKYYPKIIN